MYRSLRWARPAARQPGRGPHPSLIESKGMSVGVNTDGVSKIRMGAKIRLVTTYKYRMWGVNNDGDNRGTAGEAVDYVSVQEKSRCELKVKNVRRGSRWCKVRSRSTRGRPPLTRAPSCCERPTSRRSRTPKRYASSAVQLSWRRGDETARCDSATSTRFCVKESARRSEPAPSQKTYAMNTIFFIFLFTRKW